MTWNDPVEDVLRLLGRIAVLGPVEATAEYERDRGRVVVRPGEAAWLSPADWEPDTVCSLAGREARLVLLVARNPGSGSLGRLLAAVDEAGLEPIVCAPSHRLQDHLTRHGWISARQGEGFMAEEEWRPPLGAEPPSRRLACPG